jgi:hypothetical protein
VSKDHSHFTLQSHPRQEILRHGTAVLQPGHPIRRRSQDYVFNSLFARVPQTQSSKLSVSLLGKSLISGVKIECSRSLVQEVEALVPKVIQREFSYWASWNWDNNYGGYAGTEYIQFGYDLGTTPTFIFWSTFVDTFWNDINTTTRTTIETQFDVIIFNFRRLIDLQLVRSRVGSYQINLIRCSVADVER